MPLRSIIGHRRPLELLSRGLANGTLPPSLIFAGPTGVGKRRAAIAVAEVLNCLEAARDVLAGPGDDPEFRLPLDACGTCLSCRRVGRGVHPDVLLVTPAEDRTTVSIEQVRELNERVGFRPFEGRRRVVIVDEADEVLLGASQNALLKTLEEPPGSTVFILVAAQVEHLLSTVRSRCPQVRFGPLSPRQVATCLARDHGVDATRAEALAAVADGSVGAALGADALADVRTRVGQLLAQVARARDPRARLDAAKDVVGKAPKGVGEREALARQLRVMQGLLRDVGVLSSGSGERVLANTDVQPLLEQLQPAFGRERLVGAFMAVDRALGALDRNASPKIVADWLMLQL
jgi:DNA polymerase III subunit delta'